MKDSCIFSKSEDIVRLLHEKQIPFEIYQHPAAYTIENLSSLEIPHKEWIMKNLFLRDDKKKNYYLVTLPGYKKIDLKILSEKISSKRLSFASEIKLYEMMRLEKGHVTPFGVLNNKEKNITMIFDASLQGQIIGVHPLDNTKTMFLYFEDMLTLTKEYAKDVQVYAI